MISKLKKAGIQGRMLGIIQKIYGETWNEIIAGNGITEKFRTARGVRQGCPMSPLLFDLFIEDIDGIWERRKEGGSVIGNQKIYALKFADDIVIVAEEEKELGNMIASLEKYVEKNKLTVNIGKSKIMIFKRGGKNKKGQKWKYNNQEMEIVKEYKYLGVWFSTGNTVEKHIQIMARKIKKVINATWGIYKRARINSLWRRLFLMHSIAKSAMMYGVEIWGWRKREQVERVQARYVKMAMGLNMNTPNYIWRMEAGVGGIEIEMWKRAANYLVEIMRMPDERWPKKCLREEARGILNGNPTKWGKEMEKAMKEVGEGAIWEIIREGNAKELEKKVERGIKTKIDQEIQVDWSKIEKSQFCEEYKNRKLNIGMEKYWEDKELKGKTKETWARMRCGSIGKNMHKGFHEAKCTLCKKEEETLAHICECEEAEERIDRKLTDELKQWKEGAEGIGLERKVNATLNGKPVQALCEYVAEFEKLARKEKIKN